MGIVSEEEQGQRANAMGVILLALLGSLPIAGPLFALILLAGTFIQILMKSSTRLYDSGLLSIYVLSYIAALFIGGLVIGAFSDRWSGQYNFMFSPAFTFPVTYFFFSKLNRRLSK